MYKNCTKYILKLIKISSPVTNKFMIILLKCIYNTNCSTNMFPLKTLSKNIDYRRTGGGSIIEAFLQKQFGNYTGMGLKINSFFSIHLTKPQNSSH